MSVLDQTSGDHGAGALLTEEEMYPIRRQQFQFILDWTMGSGTAWNRIVSHAHSSQAGRRGVDVFITTTIVGMIPKATSLRY